MHRPNSPLLLGCFGYACGHVRVGRAHVDIVHQVLEQPPYRAFWQQTDSSIGLEGISSQRTWVPFHSRRDFSPVLLRKICGDIGSTLEAFVEQR